MANQNRAQFSVGCVALLVIIELFLTKSASAGRDEQARIGFRNIRRDDIPRNATAAGAWLIAHRNELTEALTDELYRTDRQGQDVILYALMETVSFKPDQRFCQTLVSRLNDEDHYVDNLDLSLHVHWRAMKYIDEHYDLFRSLILKNLETTDDMWCVWGIVSLLERHGDLVTELPKFSAHTWDTAARNLRSDNIEGNAAQAVRFYLMIGKPALSHIEPLKKATEDQTRDFASATIDAMNGSRRAYGYLASHIAIDRDVLLRNVRPPAWLPAEIDKWDSNGRPEKPRYR